MTKKLHPADIYVAQQIALCTKFAVHFRKGPTETFTVPASSLDEAKIEAKRLDAEYGKSGRRAGIYGITPDGASIIIGQSYQGR